MLLGTILKRLLMLLKMARDTNAVSALSLVSDGSSRENVAKERNATRKMTQFHRKLWKAWKRESSFLSVFVAMNCFPWILLSCLQEKEFLERVNLLAPDLSRGILEGLLPDVEFDDLNIEFYINQITMY